VKNIRVQEDAMNHTFLATAGAKRVAVRPSMTPAGIR
jgi:hypothetical protein